MLARKMLAPSVDQVPAFVSVAASKGLVDNGPMGQAVPKHFGGVRAGAERGDKKQDGEDGVDDHLGFAEIVAKVVAQLFFWHLKLLAESDWIRPIHGQSIATSGFIGKRERFMDPTQDQATEKKVAS